MGAPDDDADDGADDQGAHERGGGDEEPTDRATRDRSPKKRSDFPDEYSNGEPTPSDRTPPESPNSGPADRHRRPSGSRSNRTDGTATRSRTDDTATREGRTRVRTEEPNRRPPRKRNRVTIEDDGFVRWALKSEDGTVTFVRDIAVSLAVVGVFALLLFGVSGVWPPLVAVESGSMEPNMQKGDLIFVTDETRFVGDDPTGTTGIVTYEDGQVVDDGRFGEPGDVIIFAPGGDESTVPIIHRAMYWVEAEENWVDERANPEWTNGLSCGEIASCPAPYDGFITKGDANRGYDQAGLGGQSAQDVVRPEWVQGKAVLRIPYLGYVRLTFDSLFFVGGSAGFGSLAVSPATPLVGGVVAVSAGTGVAAVAGGRLRRR